jgi:hypothetical protein
MFLYWPAVLLSWQVLTKQVTSMAASDAAASL